MDIRRQVAYAENSRRLLRETLAAHPEALGKPFETIAQYSTIGQLVAHMIGAEQRLTQERLYQEKRPPRYEEQVAKTQKELFADWDTIRARTLTFAERADTDTLARVVVFRLPQMGEPMEMTAEEVLLHLCNHQTWHLGQVSMALQQMGIDPPNFDYVLLRDPARAPEEAI